MDLKGSLGEEEEFGGVWQSRQWELGGGGGERTCSKWEWFLSCGAPLREVWGYLISSMSSTVSALDTLYMANYDEHGFQTMLSEALYVTLKCMNEKITQNRCRVEPLVLQK